ncbi:MAG: selenium-dependent molybdenum cofactor biosynthesis protein YqeB [Treponema sp.]
MKKSEPLIIVRGAGDLASGVLAAIHISGFRVLALETDTPTAIRRYVSFSEAVRLGHIFVEGIEARLIAAEDAHSALQRLPYIPIAVDPAGLLIQELQPAVVVDAIIAKKNCGTRITMAPLVIALGPGFTAGCDAHIVIETMRGHNLGRLIYDGTALPNTGVPGLVGGESSLRVLHAPAAGVLQLYCDIGAAVAKDEVLASIRSEDGSTIPLLAPISGVLRGILPNGFYVKKGLKTADIDPRITEQQNCTTISDKARCLGGAVVTALLSHGILPQQPINGREIP